MFLSRFATQLIRRPVSSVLLKPLARPLSDDVKITDYGIRDNTRDLLHVETRNMCKCEACFGKHHHQKYALPTVGSNMHQGVVVTEVGKVSEHYVSLSWSDGHTGLIARTIQGECGPEPVPTLVNKYLHLTMRQNKCQKFWAVENAENSKAFDFNTVISSIENTREFLAHYMTHGIGFLTGIPEGRELFDIVHKDLKCGPIRATVFGVIDKVRFKIDPNNVGYGSEGLTVHTDLSYYYQQPDVQFFHCLEHTTEGGVSVWMDANSAVSEVREERPDYFKVLSEVPLYHRYTPPGTLLSSRSHHTIINMLAGNIHQVTDNPFSEDYALFARMVDVETRKLWWDAYSYFRAKVEDESRWITAKLDGGTVVVTDNWRVFHGRTPIFKRGEEQERVMATCYGYWNHLQNLMIGTEEENPCFLEIYQH